MEKLKKVNGTVAIQSLNKELAKELQEALNLLGYELIADGIVGTNTIKAFNDFKQKSYLDHPDIIGKYTIDKLEGKINAIQGNQYQFKYCYPPIKTKDGRQMIVQIPDNWVQKALSENDYHKLAKEFNVPYASLRAVVKVESENSGFLLQESSPCRPKVLFEGHWFYKLSSQNVNKIRPDLSHPNWTRKYYVSGSKEWDIRLLEAMKFDPLNALRSASWGLGQVMGFNHLSAGCRTIEQFVIEAHKGEYEQARHMFNFCKNHPSGQLIKALRNKDWVTFARLYNGSGYAKNQYDKKLAQAFALWE